MGFPRLMVQEPLERSVAHEGNEGREEREQAADKSALQNFFYAHFKDGCATGEASYLLGATEADVIGYLAATFGDDFKGKLADKTYIRPDAMVQMAGHFTAQAAIVQERYDQRWPEDANAVAHAQLVKALTRVLAADMAPPGPSPTRHETYLSQN